MPFELEPFAECFEANKEEAAGAFARAFGPEVTLVSVKPATMDVADFTQRLNGPGLLLLAKAAEAHAVFILAEPSVLLPDWYRTPDTTQNGVIQTLALEIGSLLLPESLEALDFQALAVSNVADALQRAGISDEAAWLAFETQMAGASETLWLTWSGLELDQLADPPHSDEGMASTETAPASAAPHSVESARTLPPPDDFLRGPSTSASVDSKVEQIDDMLHQAADAPEAFATTVHEERPLSPLAEFRRNLPADFDAAIHFLPIYTKSLLRIRVPVVVNLASMRKPVSQVVELGLGSILQFDKPCDEPLSLEVGGRRVAYGEVVKVGDKFGLRITSISLPPERFAKIRGRQSNETTTPVKPDANAD